MSCQCSHAATRLISDVYHADKEEMSWYLPKGFQSPFIASKLLLRVIICVRNAIYYDSFICIIMCMSIINNYIMCLLFEFFDYLRDIFSRYTFLFKNPVVLYVTQHVITSPLGLVSNIVNIQE